MLGEAGASLHLLPPELAHAIAVRALASGLVPSLAVPGSARLQTTLLGRTLPHPLGMAAGFDKLGQAVDGLFGVGFAFVEIGTVTPEPQPGNPRPRLFRLREERALINRLGFNNDGLEAMVRRLEGAGTRPGPVGANVGMNRNSADPLADYVTGFKRLHRLVDYVAINISSPNTPGLRALQGRERLHELVEALLAARVETAAGPAVTPLLIKISPDLSEDEEEGVAEVALEKAVDGLIISNTTIARPAGLTSRHRNEPGGLSGPPLFRRSTELLRRMRRLTEGRIPLIGVGGISDGPAAYDKIRAGASVLQLYTALIYQGVSVVGRIVQELDGLLERDGIGQLADAVGVDA